ncbi:tripartite tricarboxylate transporter TctB family protein [Sulfitobacter sp. LCG007]
MARLSDRVFGLIVVCVSLAYIASAYQMQTSFLSDPVGSKTFPIIVASVAILCGVIMIFRPDEEPGWPPVGTVISLVICLILLVGYAYALKPLGFILPTMVVASALSYQINPRPLAAVASGVGLALGLYVMFKFVLDLGLVGLPKGWIG